MRSREEILKEIKVIDILLHDGKIEQQHRVILELLLDIRDMLEKKTSFPFEIPYTSDDVPPFDSSFGDYHFNLEETLKKGGKKIPYERTTAEATIQLYDKLKKRKKK